MAANIITKIRKPHSGSGIEDISYVLVPALSQTPISVRDLVSKWKHGEIFKIESGATTIEVGCQQRVPAGPWYLTAKSQDGRMENSKAAEILLSLSPC